jgi:K+-sensing histidine kinase KdpD
MALDGVLSNLLELCTLNTGAFQLNLEALEIRALLDACAAASQERAKARGLAIEVGIAPELPQRIHADARRLGKVLEVMVHYAVKDSPSGRVPLLASRSRGPACNGQGAVYAGCWLEIRAANTAPVRSGWRGIRRLRGVLSCEGSLRRRLALSVASKWCEAMDGGLWLEHDTARGNSLIVRLPLGIPTEATAPTGDLVRIMPSQA